MIIRHFRKSLTTHTGEIIIIIIWYFLLPVGRTGAGTSVSSLLTAQHQDPGERCLLLFHASFLLPTMQLNHQQFS